MSKKNSPSACQTGALNSTSSFGGFTEPSNYQGKRRRSTEGAEGTNTGHENAEGMASVGVRLTAQLGHIFEQPREVVTKRFELVEALVDVLFNFATLLVLALAIEPNASLADIRAFLVLVGVLNELA